MSSIRLRLAATVLPAALALAACGDAGQSGSSETAPPTTAAAAAAAESAELAPVKVEGKPGTEPTITLPAKPFTVGTPGHRVVTPGTGKDVTQEDTVSAHFLLMNGKDGKKLESRFGKEVVGLKMADDTLQPAIRNALVGQKVGSQVLVALPAKEAVGPEGNAQMGIGADDTLLYFFEVKDVKPPLDKTALKEATGTAVAPKSGLPTVKMGAKPSDPAQITVPKSAPPKKLVVQPLIEGKGSKVEAGQTVRVSYTGTTWREPGKPFDYSGKQPQGYVDFPIGVNRVIKGWDKGIVGQPVGSRLLLVIPPADGYGEAGNPPAIKGDDTLVFVVDILGAS